MISKIENYLRDARDRQRISIALSKGIIGLQIRNVDETDPHTWEFSGFSQNGEDGIIQTLRSKLLIRNRYFVEIGSGDGIENNSSWLAVAEKYNGLMIDGNKDLIARTKRMIGGFNIGVTCKSLFVTLKSAPSIKDIITHSDPDVLSLDIDGNDYFVAKELLDSGIRPKIFVVEYNSVYGPFRNLTIKYQDEFSFGLAHPSQLYYGVSISGWRRLLESRGYKFITVDRHGVNAFFANREFFDAAFLENIKGVEFLENRYQLNKFNASSDAQFKLIENLEFFSIPE